ncbi:hypothetical protein [Candidatus Nitrospira allomarina]|uniref:Uncharacterized protein n=1 Tax=Candidatus Nitrospira allomarina TaxID=3020900 RepID=A0AA96GHU0_9BACT|nr:hypothetical protein [Candidatus Nitrospira allomarina]WNM57986.1 hypothetical protein PP769_18750 [Candidatus Nitrospira allomarina]
MLLRPNKKLLLVDLDGVLVTSSGTNGRIDAALSPLHGMDTGNCLIDSGAQIAILTHRHKSEAEQILKLLKIDVTKIVRCYAAQELWDCAIKYKLTTQTLLKGLRKSLILPLIKDELGYGPEDIAVIDDRMEILSDMSQKGVGLTLLAPLRRTNANGHLHLITFDLLEALQVFEKWSKDFSSKTTQHINLQERVVQNQTLLSNSAVIALNRWDYFSLTRKIGRTLHRYISHCIPTTFRF